MNKTAEQLVNVIFQKKMKELYERYDKSAERFTFTFEEFARDIANTRNTFFANIVRSIITQFDNQTEIVDFKEYCEYLKVESQKRVDEKKKKTK